MFPLGGGRIGWEAILRLFNPEAVGAVIIVAAIGILINGITAWFVSAQSDLNIRGAYLHMVSDAAVGTSSCRHSLYTAGYT
jgi:cobalt-zinc-cadmium efflux system protein